jgi:OOP family OmpA-OmpF porin
VVGIHGHTDSQGNPAANMTLSEARAFAVKQWLEKKSPVNFPKGRIQVFAHGQQNPVAPNSTEQGRSQNRRVEIVLGTTTAAGV